MTDIDMDIKSEGRMIKTTTQIVFDGQVIFVSNLQKRNLIRLLYLDRTC